MSNTQKKIHKKLSSILHPKRIAENWSNDWQLHQLLIAIRKRFGNYLLVTPKGQFYLMNDLEYIFDFDLTKSVLEQDEETLNKIMDILGEE